MKIFIDYQLINIHLELCFELYKALCIYCTNDFVQSMENVFGNKVMSKIGFEFTGNNRNILLFLGIGKNVTMAIIMFYIVYYVIWIKITILICTLSKLLCIIAIFEERM